MTTIRKATAATLALISLAGTASADWRLVPGDSTLGFVSVKNGRVAEGHQFTELAGSVDASGAQLVVGLASVDTMIPIRNERMREFLFEIAEYPEATFRADIDPGLVEEMDVGASRRMDVVGELELHGRSQTLNATLLITRTSEDRVSVATTRPIVLSADAYALGEGVNRLKEIAGLESITPMVPVSFSLSFVDE